METEVKEAQSLGVSGKCREPGAQCPLLGKQTQKQERTDQGHMPMSSKARSPILPDPSCPGFRTFKTHLFPTLDCTPGCVSPTVSATLAEALAERTPPNLCQQGAQLPGCSGHGMKFSYLMPPVKVIPRCPYQELSIAVAGPCGLLTTVPLRWVQGVPCSLAQ